MSATTQAAEGRPVAAPRRRPGWTVVAAKELADHLLSVRFYVLVVILGAAALIPLYFAGETIRSVPRAASATPGIFLYLFRLSPPDFGLLRVDLWVSVAAPLLGVAFAFDAINGERHAGTLPRLLSQPIHRDDVINGKLAAGLGVITIVLLAAVLVITGFGMLRLGIVPKEAEILRVALWFAVTLLYVALWLAIGMLISVVVRGAATSALIGLGLWLFVAMPFIGPALFSFVGGALAGGDPAAQQFITRLLPSTIYFEASAVLLDPEVATTASQGSLSLSQLIQNTARIPNAALGVDQSLLLIWPHIVTFVALTVGCFALAYTRFMRQEVRA
jgi:ABC-2 type transport system permease protein